VDPRRSPKIAAPSVTETMEPRSNPSSSERSKSQVATTPLIAAVISVPSPARLRDTPSTGRISGKPALSPPSNRISAKATTPIVRASS
jgi:hypothetical protein